MDRIWNQPKSELEKNNLIAWDLCCLHCTKNRSESHMREGEKNSLCGISACSLDIKQREQTLLVLDE